MDFVNCAKQRGITIRLDVSKTSGLQIYWEHTCDDREAIKNLKQIFNRDGLVAVHHFRKAYVPKKKKVTMQCNVCGSDVELDHDQYEIVTCEDVACITAMQKHMGGVN